MTVVTLLEESGVLCFRHLEKSWLSTWGVPVGEKCGGRGSILTPASHWTWAGPRLLLLHLLKSLLDPQWGASPGSRQGPWCRLWLLDLVSSANLGRMCVPRRAVLCRRFVAFPGPHVWVFASHFPAHFVFQAGRSTSPHLGNLNCKPKPPTLSKPTAEIVVDKDFLLSCEFI